MNTTSSTLPTLALAEDLTITRMGFGAMQLAGPRVFGEPGDPEEVAAVLAQVADSGITHIDTAHFYGPGVVNRLIREVLHPYTGITVATKVGGRRGPDGEWLAALDPADLKLQVHENLETLGLDTLDLVYLRLGNHDGTTDDSIEAELTPLVELYEEGLIKHLGLSGVSSAQLTEAQSLAPIVAVQNLYNLVNRQDDELVARTARENIAFASFFPLGGFSPLQSDTLTGIADRLGASRQQVALAWLLQRSATSIVIPGTSSRAHLLDNIAAADLVLPADAIAELDAIGSQQQPR